jgi:hypothetical protein
MAERKPFLLRIDAEVLDALQHWAADDLRSLNAQIEFLLRRVLIKHKRLKGPTDDSSGTLRPEEERRPTGKSPDTTRTTRG